MHEFKKKTVLTFLKEYAIITLGLIIYTTSWIVFLLPNHLVGGGATGVSSILQYGFNIPISISYFAINGLLLIIGYRTIGWRFCLKTLYGITVATLCFQFIPQFIPQDLIQSLAIDNGKLISALIGGALSGVGVGLTLAQGGSTGGTDIIAQVINKYRNISQGRVMLWCDLLIIGSSYFIADEPTVGLKVARILYGYLIMVLASYTVDLVISGSRRSVQFFIFSTKHQEIADRIANEVHRGVTVIDAMGWYTKEDRPMLMVMARQREANAISKIIKETDMHAFISVSTITALYGCGFEVIKF